ncbi:SRPBCC family protein [Hoeflea sp.]|uniref:SRPBCC family protein n=1 Tax=Hoeflea sp. TaxID=1940281 RepID=UPI001999DEB0|nr:SRPBCC family protein [Hoeflea sp.]MBC7285495.1 SRPBCC family protein [Hoeflea sp.]
MTRSHDYRPPRGSRAVHWPPGAAHDPRAAAARSALFALSAGVVLAGAALVWRSRGENPPARSDSAPGRTSRQARYGDYAVSGRTVTINRPRAELYAFWRDFSNLPRFMHNVEAVEEDGDMTIWTIRGPAGSRLKIRTRIVADRPDEQIAWRSVEGSDIDTEGKVMFRDAPGGRGTEVEAVVAYVPPGGEVGQLIAKLFQREPRLQGRREMKRFKMLMETGEVATSANRRPGDRPDGGESQCAR